jgi:glucokinase
MNRRDERWAIGVDVGGTAIKCGLVSSGGRIEAFRRIPLERVDDSDRLVAAIHQAADGLREEARRNGIGPVGVGVCAPGSIDRAEGRIHKAPNLPGLEDLPLRERLTRLLPEPVELANDVNAAALGELCFGAGRDRRHFVMVALGTGVGGALVVGGRLYTGAAGFAGEVGHITVDPHGPACPCGNVGCLERFTGAPAIEERARQLLASSSDGGSLRAASEITPETVAEAAREGDRVALQVLEETGRWLGIAFITLINLLDPECVVVGGGIAQAGAPLFDSILRTVDDRTMSSTARTVPIVMAELGPRAGMAGAGALALWPEIG